MRGLGVHIRVLARDPEEMGMFNVRSRQRAKAMTDKNLKLRARLWPGIADENLWSRHDRNGFTTVPRAMPLIMSIMDGLSKNKPVSSAYLEVWCRAYDQGFTVLKHDEMAFHAGFSGERAVRTWKERLRILNELGFINLKEGPSGPESYALILNPYHVVEQHRTKGTPGLTEARYNTMIARMSEIGATDLDQPEASTESDTGAANEA
jgi:hypothetical protein